MTIQPLICVIDDDESVRQTVGRILRGAGYAVVEAKDGEVGLRVVERELPAMIVTDIVMPNREGIETIHVYQHEQALIGWSGLEGAALHAK